MKVRKDYHIDVTEEESKLFADEICEQIEEKQPMRFLFKKTFWLVAGAHIVILVGAVCLAGPLNNTNASEIKHTGIEKKPAEEQIDQQQKDAEFVKPQPTPSPNSTSTPSPTPQPTPKQSLPQKPKQTGFTKTYVVKQGDTIYSIAKKYKLNTKRLLEINGIKDQNKITSGQTLKFM